MRAAQSTFEQERKLLAQLVQDSWPHTKLPPLHFFPQKLTSSARTPLSPSARPYFMLLGVSTSEDVDLSWHQFTARPPVERYAHRRSAKTFSPNNL